MNQPAARTAMVLSGGGAYGAFGVGVLKTLFAGRSPATNYLPLTAEIFTGTSVGAFNASLMVAQSCSCLDAALRVENIWLTQVAERAGECGNSIFRIRGNPADLVDTGCLRDPVTFAARFANDTVALSAYALARTANFLASSGDPLEDRVMALINIGSLVDSSPYEALLQTAINEEEIRQSSRILRVTATNWLAGKPRYFSNSDFQDGRGIRAVVASTAIPGVFPPVRIDREAYVDGGVVENTPLSSAIEAGGTNLHVIYLDPKPAVIRLRGEPNTIDTMLRVYYIMLATKISEDIESARWINAGLDAITTYQDNQTVSDTALRDFTRIAGNLLQTERRMYKRLVIHRYFPEAALGGSLGMLDFGIDAVARMITEGERAALLHNCAESKCVV
jgi:predicted acylesterase/phospholipase RssA